jgi:hypothetical protein
MAKLVYEIIDDLENAETEEDRINVLHRNAKHTIKEWLRAIFDDGIQFDIKEIPEYRVVQVPIGMGYTNIDMEIQRAYLFQTGHPLKSPNLSPERQKQLLIQMLEAFEPKEAKMFEAMILKKSPSKALTKELVTKAFPGLI